MRRSDRGDYYHHFNNACTTPDALRMKTDGLIIGSPEWQKAKESMATTPNPTDCTCHCHTSCPGAFGGKKVGKAVVACLCHPMECEHCVGDIDVTPKPTEEDIALAWYDALEDGTEKLLIKTLILHREKQVRRELLERIFPFDLVVTCNPDCTPEEHAYHKGTWDAHLKLEKLIQSLKEEL